MSPLLCHNPQLADPDNKWSKEISQLTHKRKKTEDDRLAISKLEWFGGIYEAPGIVEGLAYPTANIRKCLVQAAKVTRLGRSVERAVFFRDMFIPLDYGGNHRKDVKALFSIADHVHRTSVVVGGKRTMRTRPCFPKWTLTAEADVITNVLDLDDFKRIIEAAGRIEGLGDNRINGYGRFTAVVK